MSTRKSTNKSATDSPTSMVLESGSTRSSTTTRSSAQAATGSEVDATDSTIPDTKRPRRSAVRTPTTPSSSNKKKTEDNDETTSTGGDVDDDKSVKSSEDAKSEDGKKTESQTDSPVRAARKRKVFDKTPIVTRKSAMDLAKSTKRVLRCDRRNSTGKFEILENEPKRRSAVKKSTSSTPEPPSSSKRKRTNSVKSEDKEDIKRPLKVIKIETVELEEVQKVDNEAVEQKIKEVKEEEEEDKLKLLVEETDSKDDELVEVVAIKQEIDDETDVPIEENFPKVSEAEQDKKSMTQVENVSKEEKKKDEEGLSDSEIVIAKLFASETDSKKLTLSGGKDVKKSPGVTQTLVSEKVIVKKEEPELEEDSKYEAYEKPRRAGRPKKSIDVLSSLVTRGNKKNDKANSAESGDNKGKVGKKVQPKSPTSTTNKVDETKNCDSVTESEAGSSKVENITQDTINGVEEPLTVDTSTTITATEKELPSTSSDQNCEKAASLSPELVSEGVNVISVKQFYKKPEFLENNLGIEKDPKLGGIVQEVEKTKDESDDAETQIPCNSTDSKCAEEIIPSERSPSCSGDSLKEGERLVLEDSTEDDGNSSTNKIECIDDGEATTSAEDTGATRDLINSKESELLELKVEEEGMLSNSADADNADALQIICDSTNRITAVDNIDEEKADVYESDTEIKDKIACSKSSNDEKKKSDELKLIENTPSDTRLDSNVVEKIVRRSSSEEIVLMDVDQEVSKAAEDEVNAADSEDIPPEQESTSKTEELKIDLQEDVIISEIDVDEVNENKENVSETADIKDVKDNIQICVGTPKKVSFNFLQYFQFRTKTTYFVARVQLVRLFGQFDLFNLQDRRCNE